MSRNTLILVLMLICSNVLGHSKQATTAKSIAQALIGIEYVPLIPGAPIAPGEFSCNYLGGGLLHLDGTSYDDWAENYVKCRGQTIVLLGRKVVGTGGREKLRVVDTLPLPSLTQNWHPKHLDKTVLYRSVEGACDLPSRPHTAFIALLRWGKRDRIDWRTGVEKAWTFDIRHGRIVPLSTRDIVCEYVEP